jgi:hypothetical protein
MRFTYVLIVVTTLGGCASEPAKQVSSPPSAAAGAPAAPVVTTAAQKPTEKADPKASASGEYFPPAGYQKKTKGSTTVYCRSDTPVGTRFATEYCYTQTELERMEASRSSIRQDVDRARRTCVGAGCGGG